MGNSKLRIAITGLGNRALPKDPDSSNWDGWVKQIQNHPGYELIAAHDPVEKNIDCRQYEHLSHMLFVESVDVLLVCSPIRYHDSGILAALNSLRERGSRPTGLIVEKPFCWNIHQGEVLLEDIKELGVKTCIVQNWRFKDVGQTLRANLKNEEVAHIFFCYTRNRENPNYPDYIFKEPYPPLYAMGIHHLDLFRYILRDEVEWVTGQAFRPEWSLYESYTGVNLFLQMKSGVPVVYTSTFSSPGYDLNQENLLIEGRGFDWNLLGDWGDGYLFMSTSQMNTPPKCLPFEKTKEQYDKADKYILDSFYETMIHGAPEICSAEDAFKSVLVVEAARKACETGEKVYIKELS